MKLKLILPIAAFAVISCTSCKKDSSTTEDTEIETTFELSTGEGISENLTQDANEILNEAAYDKNLLGSGFAAGTGQTNSILSHPSKSIKSLSLLSLSTLWV